MAGKPEKPEEKPAATSFENVSVPAIVLGDTTATVSGKLVRKAGSEPIEDVEIAITVHPMSAVFVRTDASGKFAKAIDTANLTLGGHAVELIHQSDASKNIDANSTKTSLAVNPKEGPAVPTPNEPADVTNAECDTPSNEPNPESRGGLMTAIKRALCDPQMTAGVADFLRGDSAERTSALGRIADAIEGQDALAADKEPCKGQLLFHVLVDNAATGKLEFLSAAQLRRLDVQIVDANFNIAVSRRTYEQDGILFSDVEAAESPNNSVYIALASEVVDEQELSALYAVKQPNEACFEIFTNTKIKTDDSNSGPQSSAEKQQKANAAENAARKLRDLQGKLRRFQLKDAETRLSISSILATGLESDPREPKPTPGFLGPIFPGKLTIAQCIVTPPQAMVRCFSSLDGDIESCCCPSCSKGSPCEESLVRCDCRYISNVCIHALRGDDFVASCHTGKDGSVSFTQLDPGWYRFMAPKDISIHGCNYEISSSSPISAYVGPGQKCSDIVFCYKKKGSEILVNSVVSHPEGDNPEEIATENLPGVNYLLLREGDTTFAQQLTSEKGEAVSFKNLAAGTYWLFCQAPETFGSKPLYPVFPPQGRLTLSVFAGQVGVIPVEPKFRTSNSSSAKIEGHVRDDSGFALAQQIVQVKNTDGYVIAAALTDSTGYYSIRVYRAEDIQIVQGTQTNSITKAQLLVLINPVGPALVPFAQKTLNEAVQAAQLLGV